MAPESCNLDKEEAEVLKPSSPTPHPPPAPPSPSHPPLFLNHSKTTTPEKFEALISKPAEESPPPVRLVNRCSNCQKRVGLTGFRCRCGDLFCARHRYFNSHDCSYDYKAAGREEISKANPVIRAAKIIKI